jgi:predicted DCC family thiol-disulfide oxidoreductase YuxK
MIPFDFEVFYDGACPLCTREVLWLRRRDQRDRIRFTDIADPKFDPTSLGLSWAALMERIHGRMPDGSLVLGVEVFRQLYAAVGFRRLVAATRLPGVSQLLDLGYRSFAKNRLRLTGRCEVGVCQTHGGHGATP